jgi:hypothetical protein
VRQLEKEELIEFFEKNTGIIDIKSYTFARYEKLSLASPELVFLNHSVYIKIYPSNIINNVLFGINFENCIIIYQILKEKK